MTKRTRWMAALLALCLALLLILGSCGASEDGAALTEGASANGTLEEDTAGELQLFQISVAQAGDPVGVDLRGVLQNGGLRVQLTDKDGNAVWQEEASTIGIYSINTVVEAPAAGNYQVGLVWDGPVTASYSLTWRPGQVELERVSPIALLSGLGMIAVAAGFIVYAAVRRLGWRYLGLGALAWVVTVALKLGWALAANTAIYNALQAALPGEWANLTFYLYVGALTGLFEVGLVWLVMRYTRLGRMTWSHALAFGIGFGAIEALLLGLQSLANMVVAVWMPEVLPLGADLIAQINNPLYLLAPIVERFFTVLVHIFTNLLIIYGARMRRAVWFWLAFAYKSALDAVAAFAQVQGLTGFPELWAIEAVVIVWGIAGWLGIRWLRGRWDAGEAPDVGAQEPD